MSTQVMPKDLSEKCHYTIHSAATACAGLGISPMPGSDIAPMCAVQVTMIMGLARIFNISISNDLAKQMSKAFMIGNAGKFICAQLVKVIPVLGSGANAVVAFALTEAFGWEVANDFWCRSLKEKRN